MHFKVLNKISSIKGIKRFLIIENTGLNIFTKEFVDEKVDEVLFAGFFAAIIAFAKELGKELESLRLNGETFYFKSRNNFIFILSTTSELKVDEATKFLDQVIESVNWNELKSYLNQEVYFLTKDFEDIVDKLMAELQNIS